MRALRRQFRRLPHPWQVGLEWLGTIGFAVALVLTIKVEVANPYRIPSASMEPTLRCARPADGCSARFSDRVIANRFIYRFREPRRGEEVVFDAPELAAVRCSQGGTYVKRIVGLPGEIVSERNGIVFVDGKRLAEPYLDAARRDHQTRTWRKVPRDHYFMLGDNRARSCDSRIWGPVPRERLIGPVIARYWPPDRLSIG